MLPSNIVRGLVFAPLSLVALAACAGDRSRPPPPSPSPVAVATAATPTPPPEPGSNAPATLAFRAVALLGVTAPAAIDYLAFEPGRSRVWVPVGAGSVDVYDTKAGTFARIDGFKTDQREHGGKTRTVGPNAVSIGEGAAYVGNRATSEVCSVDTETLRAGGCLKLDSSTDGVVYVSSTKEVWATMPRARSIAVLDATTPLALKAKTVVHLDGAPEGYAVDLRRGLFFTNLEDKNETVVIDVATHTPKATWSLACDADGPRGVSADTRGFVFVACTDRVLVLDGLHDGVKLSTVEAGAGVDNIDWSESQQLLYAAAGKAARLTIAHVDDKGLAATIAVGTSVEGARNGVADGSGNAYVPDSMNARLLIFASPK